MITDTKCIYCDRVGIERLNGDDPVYVCGGCWKILQDPKTALPFLRGHLTLELRGEMSAVQLQQQLNRFMSGISKWKRPD